MTDRTIVIVGGTRGIGLELAKDIVARGDQVVITGRDAARTAEIAASIGDAATGVGDATTVGGDTPTSGSDVPPVATAAVDPVASLSCLVTAATCFSMIVVTFKIIGPGGRADSTLVESMRDSDVPVSAVLST